LISGNILAGKDEVSPEAALQRLMSGNKRFVESKAINPNQSAKRRTEVANEQRPFAIIVTCSDSRVAPEVLFDLGLGDIFVIRVAGNITDDNALGSIEFAAERLGSNLVVVMGHSKCAAVIAAVQEGEIPGCFKSITDAIKPAVDMAKSQSGDIIENSIKNNAKLVAEKIRASKPILEELVKPRLSVRERNRERKSAGFFPQTDKPFPAF